MKIGFTGSREGMTAHQQEDFTYHVLHQGLDMFGMNEFHHGDCIGADAEAHGAIRSLTEIPFKIFIHPPESDKYRAFCNGDVTYDPKSFLDRNKDIVLAVDLLIAAPRTKYRVPYSGTWSTVTKAHNKGIPVIMLIP